MSYITWKFTPSYFYISWIYGALKKQCYKTLCQDLLRVSLHSIRDFSRRVLHELHTLCCIHINRTVPTWWSKKFSYILDFVMKTWFADLLYRGDLLGIHQCKIFSAHRRISWIYDNPKYSDTIISEATKSVKFSNSSTRSGRLMRTELTEAKGYIVSIMDTQEAYSDDLNNKEIWSG